MSDKVSKVAHIYAFIKYSIMCI